MSKFLTLTKVLFKTSGEALVQKDKKKLPKIIGFAVLMAVAFLPMVAGFVAMAASVFEPLSQIGQAGLIIEIAALASCMLVFVFGIFYVLSTFYFSSDVEKLLPLPLKPSMILGAKFTIVLVYEYLTELVFLLPIMITYGIKSEAGILYYLFAVIVFVVLPVIPLIFASFISMVVMRFTPFVKNKDAFNMFAGIFGLALALGFNMVFQRFGATSDNPEQLMQTLINGNNSLVGTMSKVFPTAKLAVNGLVFSSDVKGIINILLLLVVTIALIALFIILGETLYFKGVIGISQAASKRKKLSSAELDESTVQSSVLKSYIIKELKILFRTPAYFMNCVLMNFLMPVFLLLPLVAQPDILKEVPKIRSFVNDPNIPGYIIAIAFGVFMFISVANPTSGTAISREGRNLFVCKYLPVSYRKQLMAKIWSHVVLNAIGLTLIIIMAMVIAVPPVTMLLQLIVLAALVTLFSAFTGILVDLTFPKLEWDTEQRAVKQNMNVLIIMLLGWVIAGLTIFGVVMLGLNLWGSFGVLAGALVVIDALLYYALTTYGIRAFMKLGA
jgi:ABC-2 type transport system permease protein